MQPTIANLQEKATMTGRHKEITKACNVFFVFLRVFVT